MSVFVAFRTLICEPGCKQVFLSPVIHVKYLLHTYITYIHTSVSESSQVLHEYDVLYSEYDYDVSYSLRDV